MGVDWRRMKPKPDTNLDELRRLAREEAVAYQSINGWYPVCAGDPIASSIQLELHSATWGTSATAVRERTDWAEWDRERDCAADHPDLQPAWRVSVVSQNPTFPPLVRCQAFRTILPDELPDQLTRWRQWAEAVARGERDDYLRELHWYATADWASYHWSCLHGSAIDSLAATGSWASKPELIRVREEVLQLPQPVVPRIGVTPEGSSRDRAGIETAYPAILTIARRLAELTRQWDRCVRKKLRYYESCYQFTLDEFRAGASGQWLQEFFAWAARCVELEFGLCLHP